MAAKAATHDKLEVSDSVAQVTDCFSSMADRRHLLRWRLPWVAAGAAMTEWGTHRSLHKLLHQDDGWWGNVTGILRRQVLALSVAALVAITLFATALLAQTFPVLTGRVVDAAELLSPAQEKELNAGLAALEAKSTDQLVVVTVPSLEGYAIEDYSNRLARSWAVGQKGRDNGAVLVVAPNDRKVRIEVGRGLEPVLTDALTSVIIQSTILPRFRRGDFAGGVIAGVKDITDSLTGDAAEVERRARGGGAKPAADWTDWLPLLFWIAIVIVILWHAHRNQRVASRSGRYSRRRGRGDAILPGSSGSSGGWSGGGWSGGSGDGFSGGGGSFGGGGSSGSW